MTVVGYIAALRQLCRACTLSSMVHAAEVHGMQSEGAPGSAWSEGCITHKTQEQMGSCSPKQHTPLQICHSKAMQLRSMLHRGLTRLLRQRVGVGGVIIVQTSLQLVCEPEILNGIEVRPDNCLCRHLRLTARLQAAQACLHLMGLGFKV